jgi:hypothetical protein
MPIDSNQYYEGIFVNPDAMDAKTKEYLAKMVSSVLKQAGEMSIAPSLFVPNPLDAKMGTVGKFYDWGQLVARLKPDGVPTGLSKIKPTDHSYELDEYEVKVGITDKAKLNGQMQAQDLLTAGNSARAFARAFDAQAFNTVLTDMNSTGGSNWSTETDANVLDQIDNCIGFVDDAGFDPDAMVMTRKQRSRITKIGLTYANPLTAEELIQKEWPQVKKIHIWKKIQVKKPDASVEMMFDPTGEFFVIDTKACGVFTQRPTTLESFRDVDAGVDFAYMRKYFKTDLVQLDAAHKLDSLVI